MKFYLFADKDQKVQVGLIDLQSKLNAHSENLGSTLEMIYSLGSYDRYGVQSVIVVFEK